MRTVSYAAVTRDSDHGERRRRLGIGLAALGRPAYITAGRAPISVRAASVDDMRTAPATVLDAAYAAGVRYVDVARSYGRAEEFLAGWLAARPEADDVEVGSKWGYRYIGDWRMDAEVHEIKDHSLAAFSEQWAQTRALLGDRLGVYHVHSATPETGVLDDARAAPRAGRAARRRRPGRGVDLRAATRPTPCGGRWR